MDDFARVLFLHACVINELTSYLVRALTKHLLSRTRFNVLRVELAFSAHK